jgi:hypothetical protein
MWQVGLVRVRLQPLMQLGNTPLIHNPQVLLLLLVLLTNIHI